MTSGLYDAAGHPNGNPKAGAPSKGVDDYLKALRRRLWLVALVTVLAGGAGTVFTFYQKPVYWASSRILIEPPQTIVQGLNDDGRRGSDASQNFFSTRIEMITSRQIAERVLQALQLSEWDELNGVEDPVGELLGWISVKPVKNSNLVDVGIEGGDPQLVAKIVNSTVEEFMRYEQESLREFNQSGRARIDSELRALGQELHGARQKLNDFHKIHQDFLLDGQSVEAAHLAILEEAKAEANLKVDAAKREVERFQALREAGVSWHLPESIQKIEEVRTQIRRIDDELEYQKSVIRPERYDRDIAIRRMRDKRDELQRSIEKIGAEDADFELQRLKQEVEFAEFDAQHLEDLAKQQRRVVLAQQDDQNSLQELKSDFTRIASLSDFMERRRGEIEVEQGLVSPRIQVIDRAEPPRVPIRPIKYIQIPLIVAGSVMLGCLLVVGLEFANRRIREPEHLMDCLDWPLLGVIPRVSRRSLVDRKGVLRPASEQPGTQVCEAFRNLRTGVLGAEDEEGLRTLLVASPSPGEGKTTVAANLATACARAGESVLLIDMDLRQPQADRLFSLEQNSAGLVQVLEDELPWEEVVVEARVANLSVLPTGNVEGAPLDILGTMEMFELLNDVSEKFDRVIIDGPALLGLADSRVVGRFADGVLLVVKAGMHDSRPILRLRQVLEHEGLRHVGVVFNATRFPHVDLPSSQLIAQSRPGVVRGSRKKQPTVEAA